ncbi:hypothetical protein AF332_11325 [Sporosarcina globispora]|uniref:Uncharacterized protein n=1 Tax=Sporosarcina globispora TaxID=1459 RepID=A0A0M0GCU0_SPOGL|nr:hypothetical protein [Sporosarcina globispora]KON87357.1 hypothetical protein AF332_11325 [Sporosarcina globispora]
MEKLHWTVEEVVAFLEDMISSEEASDMEIEMYQDYIWNQKFNKIKYFNTYKLALRKMRRVYDGS